MVRQTRNQRPKTSRSQQIRSPVLQRSWWEAFGAFATSRVLPLRQFGLGLGIAVLIDATVIRVVLLPATMKLLGEWKWYMLSWLGWLPKITQEESHPLIAPPKAQGQPVYRRVRLNGSAASPL